MGKMFEVNGFTSRPGEGGWMPTKITVVASKDDKGCTVSLCNRELDLQYTVPFDEALEYLERNGG